MTVPSSNQTGVCSFVGTFVGGSNEQRAVFIDFDWVLMQRSNKRQALRSQVHTLIEHLKQRNSYSSTKGKCGSVHAQAVLTRIDSASASSSSPSS
jgi:hypothetical protein